MAQEGLEEERMRSVRLHSLPVCSGIFRCYLPGVSLPLRHLLIRTIRKSQYESRAHTNHLSNGRGSGQSRPVARSHCGISFSVGEQSDSSENPIDRSNSQE